MILNATEKLHVTKISNCAFKIIFIEKKLEFYFRNFKIPYFWPIAYNSLATLASVDFIHFLNLHIAYYGEVKVKECEAPVVSHRDIEKTPRWTAVSYYRQAL